MNTLELLQNLIRIDTTNPPGNEKQAIYFIRDQLEAAGITSTLLARTPERPNLVARLPGEGNSPALLLYGHLDVVTTANQDWQVPPFEGRIQDGYLWGRGALDMKGPVAMMLAAFLKAKENGLRLPGEVIFTALADEEAGSAFGAKFLVQEHSDLFQGVRYAFGEFGGFNLSLLGKRFYPIMISEKQGCWLALSFHGAGGHGSMPVQGEAMAQLGQALERLDRRKLPVHITPPVRLMINSLAKALPGATGLALRQLANPALAGTALRLTGERAALFDPLLRNTACPTMLEASDKINVIPNRVRLGIDGRMVPGAKPEEFIAELHNLLGMDFDTEILETDPGPAEADMGLFDMLHGVLRQFDPQGIPIPYVLSGITDARFFSRLGIQTYGFTPLRLPEDFNFISTVHTANERVPVEALDFGVQAIYQALQQF